VALLGNLTGSSQFFNPSNFYNGVATTSLRLDKASSGYLYRTPSSATNRRTFTIAFWYKTSIVFASEANDQNNPIFYADEPSGGGVFALNVSGQGQGAASDTVNEMQYYDYDSADTTDYGLETNSSFADPSAWYHVVWAFDTTQGTEANRVKVYINGVQHAYTDMNAHHGAVVQNRELNVNQATPHWIGRNVDTTSRYMNGYLADFNFIDGTQYDASYFGEFKNGIWIPKEPSVTYGTNGFRLQFKNTSVGSGSSSTIGADTSGNDNHFTSSGIAASDCAMPDSPENNFCTWCPISTNDLPDLTEGSLKNGGTNNKTCHGTFGVTSGKWYWEERWLTDAASSSRISYSGVTSYQMENNGDVAPKLTDAIGRSVYRNTGNEHDYINFTDTSKTATSGGTYWGGAIASFRLDMDAGTFKVYTNNSLVHTDSSIPTDGTVMFPLHLNTNSGYARYNSAIVNFGQDSSFAGNETAQGNTDENGIGDFYYEPPSGHLALASFNLPEVTISPNSLTQSDDHFNTVLYTGNATARSITGVGFQPDWVWSKARGLTQSHRLVDSTRGVQKSLYSNLTDAEATESGLTAFNADGFSIGTETSFNYNTEAFVAWNWKANGGTTSSNSDGSITSTVQANTDAGFSIVTFTGTGSNATVGHGLGSKPEWFLIKNRDASTDFTVYHQSIGATKNLSIHASDGAATSATRFNNTEPTDSVFTVSTSAAVNGSSADYVVYCFSEVEGYSKFGSYTANESTDGPFIYLGFRPAWVMIKRTAGNGWAIQDNARTPSNPISNLLQANESNAEYTDGVALDFVSNGIKHRNNSGFFNHVAGDTFIYMAFAEAPFKYANAR